MKNYVVAFLLILVSTQACYYDVEEDFSMGGNECMTDGITYSGDIVSILSNRCYKCHAANLNLGDITLEGYNKLKIYVDNGRLLGAIRRENGFSPMPQNEAMLPDCDILKIETWISNGAPNN
ncbi:MAG: hypothetical protein HKN76_00610 [Saprospiraceae bacterium]|nr:hypothetical protein [Saprospiraceae bacterium]